MKRMLTLLVLSLLVYVPQSHAGLGKSLSMLGCGAQSQKKKLFDSVIDNTDPSKPQIWAFKVRKGKLVMNPNPRQWFTLHKKEELKAFCWEARKSRYVTTHRLSMSPSVTKRWYCGRKVYACIVGSEGGDNDGKSNSGNNGGGDPDGDNGGNPGSGGGDPDGDDGAGGPPSNF